MTLRQLFLPVALLFTTAALAQPIGEVVRLEGEPGRVFRESWQNLGQREPVFTGDLIRTRSNTRLMTIGFNDGSELALDANTRLEIQRYDQGGAYTQVSGRVRAVVTQFFSNRPNAFEMQTRTAIIGVQGTIFRVSADAGATRVDVEEGVVSVRSLDPNISGTRTLTAGQFTIVRRGQPPTPPALSAATGGSTTTTITAPAPATTVGSGSTLDLEADGTQANDPTGIAPGLPTPVTVPRQPTLPPQ